MYADALYGVGSNRVSRRVHCACVCAGTTSLLAVTALTVRPVGTPLLRRQVDALTQRYGAQWAQAQLR